MEEKQTLYTRVNKLEVVTAQHGEHIKDNEKDLAKLNASCDNFKEFMVETRAEARQRDKSLNKFATIIGIVSALIPFVTAWIVSLINNA